MARRLPLESPRPHSSEAEAVAALRERGYLIRQGGREGQAYEGKDGGRAGAVSMLHRSEKPGDDDLRMIGRLPRLESLDLHSANLSDEGLEHLAGLKHLKRLTLRFDDGAKVTPEGIRSIAELQTLEWLSLSGISVTDDAVPHLARLTNLAELSLQNGCEITDEGLKQLKKALPDANIACR